MADSLMVYAWRLEEMADAAALTKSQRDNLLDVAAVLREQPGEPQDAPVADVLANRFHARCCQHRPHHETAVCPYREDWLAVAASFSIEQPFGDSDIEDVAQNCERAANENDPTQMRSMLRCAAHWLRQPKQAEDDIFSRCMDCGLEADYRCHTEAREVIFPPVEGICTARTVYPHPFKQFGEIR